jgi:replicative DNA helicase
MDLTDINKNKNRKQRNADLSTMIYGKVPPQAKDVEEAILGAIMLDRSAYDRAAELMTPEAFYVEAHQRIYTAMQTLARSSKPIDILTVCEELKRTEELEMVGGSYYVQKLTNSVTSGAHVEHHCRLVYEKFLKRELIRIGGEMIGEAYEDSSDPFELLDASEKSLNDVSSKRGGNSVREITSVLVDRVKHIGELRKHDSNITGIPSGYTKLDLLTHGWQRTDLIILAARPGVGKTAFALNLARNAASGKAKVLMFSLEMSMGQLVDRMISAQSEVPLTQIMTGTLSDAQMQHGVFTKGIQPLSSMGIFLDDTPALNVYDLRSRTKYSVRKYGKPGDQWLVIVDYLQLMSGVEDRKINNREQEISNVTRNLKKLAKELQVPIIALSQLSRALEQRGGNDKTPKLSDLRESGAIEQDADTVLFIYRPEYHGQESNEMGESTKGLTEISIAKNRHGPLAQGPEAVRLRARLDIQKFVEWDGWIVPPSTQGSWRPVRDIEKDEDPFP